MPEPKTIDIDEILPAESGEDHSTGTRKSADPTQTSADPNQPFPDLTTGLGWKASLTLQLTRGFLFIRSKSWGKWIIVPLVILFVLLVIPLAILAVITLILISILRAIFQPTRNGNLK